MIKVNFPEPQTAEWQKWRTDVEKATQKLIKDVAETGICKIQDRLYKQTKKDIFQAFHGKCAYCEANIQIDQHGDVEHFRPKKGLADINGLAITGHRGYYWLAYDWRNLLPSCVLCNQQKRNERNILVGKGIRFPIAATHWTCPDDLFDEQPLLIHPAQEDPAEHFIFDTKTGFLGGRTARGKACITVFDLNREGLPIARRKEYIRTLLVFQACVSRITTHDFEQADECLKQLHEVETGVSSYSLAGRAALHTHRSRILTYFRQLDSLINNLPESSHLGDVLLPM